MGSADSAQFYGRFESTSLGLYFEDCLMLDANLIQDDNRYFMVWPPDSMTTLGQRWAYNVGYVGSMLAQCWPSPLVQC